jgi:glycosyltransferase involved in cell wall biosynthesis
VRIAFYAPLKPPTHPVPSGDRRMARLLMAALSTAGHEVSLACRFRSWDDGARPGRHRRLADLGHTLADRLTRRLARDPPDLWFTYHLYHKAPDWLGPAVTRDLGIPYVVAEASYAPKQAGGPFALGHAAAAAAIARADAVVALTTLDTECLLPLLATPDRLVRLRPFLDTGTYAATAAERARHRADLAAAHGLPPDRPWLLAVGMMRRGDKQRSYRVLAHALERLTALDWQLLVVGDGPQRAAIEHGFAALPADRLRFLGALPPTSLAAAYAAADLMIWPAINEAYGMALLEAQAAGLPVVAGRTGGVPDVVRDGITGLLTPVGDASAFATAVAALLTDPARRHTLGSAAARIAATEHDIAAAARTLDAVVRRVTGSPPRKPPR